MSLPMPDPQPSGAVAWFKGSVLASLAVVVACWFALPEGRIPLHWGADGVDNWGTRGQAIAVMLGVWAVFAGLMGGFIRWSARMDLTLVNVPRKDHWSLPENEPRLRARLREDMALTGTWMMVLAAAVSVVMTMAARSGDAHEWLAIGFIGAWTVVLFAGIWARMSFYRAG